MYLRFLSCLNCILNTLNTFAPFVGRIQIGFKTKVTTCRVTHCASGIRKTPRSQTKDERFLPFPACAFWTSVSCALPTSKGKELDLDHTPLFTSKNKVKKNRGQVFEISLFFFFSFFCLFFQACSLCPPVEGLQLSRQFRRRPLDLGGAAGSLDALMGWRRWSVYVFRSL